MAGSWVTEVLYNTPKCWIGIIREFQGTAKWQRNGQPFFTRHRNAVVEWLSPVVNEYVGSIFSDETGEISEAEWKKSQPPESIMGSVPVYAVRLCKPNTRCPQHEASRRFDYLIRYVSDTKPAMSTVSSRRSKRMQLELHTAGIGPCIEQNVNLEVLHSCVQILLYDRIEAVYLINKQYIMGSQASK